MDLLEILAAGSGGGLGSIGASCGGVRGKEELGLSPRTDPRPSPAPPAPTRGDGGPTPRQLEDDEDGTYTPRFVSAKPSGRKPAVLTRSLNSPRINALNSPRAAPGSRGAGSLGSPRASLPSGRREEPGEQVMSFSLARSLSSLSLSLSSAALSICLSVHLLTSGSGHRSQRRRGQLLGRSSRSERVRRAPGAGRVPGAGRWQGRVAGGGQGQGLGLSAIGLKK